MRPPRRAIRSRQLQAWVLDEQNDLNQLMPDAEDLPEGLSDAQMQNGLAVWAEKRMTE